MRNTRCIVDCTEIVIERSKSLDEQAATWSDYKKQYFEILGGFIMQLSNCYGGRASDQFICFDSKFYNHLEYGDEIFADWDFQIKEDLMLYYCKLFEPPEARIRAQMTAEECREIKEIASVTFLVE